MTAPAASFDPNESICKVMGGFASFWGCTYNKLHVTHDALVLVRKNKIVGHAYIKDIESFEPTFYYCVWNYIASAVFWPYIFSPLLNRSYFTLKLRDGTAQLLFVNKAGRTRWRKCLSDALTKCEPVNPAPPTQIQITPNNPQPMPKSRDAAKDLLNRLEQLGRLPTEGVLTNDEFQQQKQRILAQV